VTPDDRSLLLYHLIAEEMVGPPSPRTYRRVAMAVTGAFSSRGLRGGKPYASARLGGLDVWHFETKCEPSMHPYPSMAPPHTGAYTLICSPPVRKPQFIQRESKTRCPFVRRKRLSRSLHQTSQ
jgi:hypothetical protein